MTQKLDRKHQKLNEFTERLQQLKASLNELRAERLKIETDLQRRTRLEESKDELTSANEALDREIVVSKWLLCLSHLRNNIQCVDLDIKCLVIGNLQPEAISYCERVAPCGLRGCKNGPAPFPGRMSYKATKPGLVCLSYLSMMYYCNVVY